MGTPGRFLHLVVEMELRLDLVEYVVFDEADRCVGCGDVGKWANEGIKVEGGKEGEKWFSCFLLSLP